MTLKSIDYDYKEKLYYTEYAKEVLAYIRCIVSPSTGSQKNFIQEKSNKHFGQNI